MTEVLEYLRARNERLVTIPRKKPISEYSIGDCEYEECGVDCENITVATLYHQLCCGEYDPEFQQTYELLHNHIRDHIQSDTLAVGKEQIESYIEAMFLSDVFRGDKTFHDHVDAEHKAPNTTLDNSEKQRLAKLWLFYLAERGVET